MKKGFFAIALTVMLIFSMMTTVFADNFVSSVSEVPAPAQAAEPTSSNPDWKGTVTVSAYGEQAELSEEAKAEMTAAYESVKAAADVTALSSDVAAIAADKGVTVDALAVSDIFDISVEGADYGTLTITLKSDSFENFVALLHYTGSAWEVVKDAKVEGNVLTFSADNFSPFAVVVSTDVKVPDSPKTGDSALAILAAAVVTGIAGVGVLCYGRKKAN